MDDLTLNEALERYRERTAQASLPANFQQNVWRAIRQRRALHEERPTWRALLCDMLLSPRTVLGSLAMALALGVAMGARTAELPASQAREALDLGVFGHEAPTLPATLLASRI
jgi:hypothetical protein